MKNIIKKALTANNLILMAVIGFVLANQAPTIANNLEKKGKKLGTLSADTLGPKGTKKVNFPPAGKAIAIFWSTTCGPCKLEMARLKASVEAGKIPKEAIFALNSFEPDSHVKRFLKKNDYPFTFIKDPGLGALLNIRATPTTLFIDKGEVLSMKSGMSLTGIWSAENFLSGP